MRQILYIFSLLFLLGCEKDPIPSSIVIDNIKSSSIDYTSSSIQFSLAGNAYKTGVMYGLEKELLNGQIQYAEKISGEITISLKELKQGTEYFYKVFAEDKKGNRMFSEIKNFITLSASVTTGEATGITTEAAILSLSFKGENISEIGVLYSTDELCKDNLQTVSTTSLSDNNFNFEVKGLQLGTTYYYKAYVKYKNGTISYGEIRSFLTSEQYLKVSTTTIEATAEGGIYQFEIESKNVDWKISCDQDWCTIDPISGSGNEIISITIISNMDFNDRVATIFINDISINIIQKGQDQKVSTNVLSSLAHYCGSGGGMSMYFAISSKESWTINSNSEWCEIQSKSGTGNGIVYFSVKENTGNQCRVATININFTNETQNFYVLQNYHGNPIICGVYSDYTDGRIQSPINWTAKSNATWCTLSNTSGKNGDYFNFIYSDNKRMDRVAIITIESGGYTSLYMKTQREEDVYIQSKLPSYEMAFVKGGSFLMGSNSYHDTQPLHEVILEDFYIGKYEVTQRLWKFIMGTNPSVYKGDDLPVESVSWADIQVFIIRLNDLTGLKYRLPTEAEWEYAASGGNNSQGYSFSGSDNFDEVGWNDIWYYSGHTSAFVGMKKSNELGIYDMTGNVGEICSDWYGTYPNGLQRNPTGPIHGTERVIRGEKSMYIRGNCTGDIKERYKSKLDGGHMDFGFRLVLDK
nr:SUMF1/EgtB/PvdO family nonheme iron enzyme [Parabacteroides goldsteinii]